MRLKGNSSISFEYEVYLLNYIRKFFKNLKRPKLGFSGFKVFFKKPKT